MRILYFSRSYTVHDYRFLTKLAQSQHDVWFLALMGDAVGQKARLLPDGVCPVGWEGSQQSSSAVEGLLSLMPAFEVALERVRPDLVHAGPVQSCAFMTALSGFSPFLAMSWGSDILLDADRDAGWRWITRYTLEHSRMLLCDCRSVRQKAQQIAAYADERIVEFPWGVDLTEFAPGVDSLELRRELGWDNAVVVLSTRSWEPLYGVDVLLEAFRLACSQDHRLRLVMLGSGSVAAAVRNFVASNALGEVVFLAGSTPHEQLRYYFRAADLYVSCSYSDGSSVSLLEAMASGLPVVVTDLPGNREWVIQERNGWLVPAGDSKAFALALLRAAAMQAPERERLSKRNRCVAEERADWNVNFGKLLAAYHRIEEEIGC